MSVITLYKELQNLQFCKSIFYSSKTLQSLRTVGTVSTFNLSLTVVQQQPAAQLHTLSQYKHTVLFSPVLLLFPKQKL